MDVCVCARENESKNKKKKQICGISFFTEVKSPYYTSIWYTGTLHCLHTIRM